MTAPARPRGKPCDSCPYRRDVPAGIWAAEEYAKLPAYDGEIAAQAEAGALGPFHCHQAPAMICSGWAGCHDMDNLLAVRWALLRREVDPCILDYETDVPLFGSGAEAAAHGLAGIEQPSAQAQAKIRRLLRLAGRQTRRGTPRR